MTTNSKLREGQILISFSASLNVHTFTVCEVDAKGGRVLLQHWGTRTPATWWGISHVRKCMVSMTML